jgi:predicted metal-binding membrane protein
MRLLAAVMVIEKNADCGQRVSASLGVVLLAWAVVLVATHA